MKGTFNASVAGKLRRAAFAASLAAAVCLLGSDFASAQHRQSAPRSAPAPHYSAPRQPQGRPQNFSKPSPSAPQYRGAPAGGGRVTQYGGTGQQPPPAYRGFNTPQPGNNFRPAPNAPQYGATRPANPATTYQGQGYRPGYSGSGQSQYAPPGHLGAWLNDNRGKAPQQQEQMLRNDPSFNRLPQAQQQRLMQQLNRVDKMPEAQRQRTLARAENIERLSPQERTQLQESTRRWTTLPADRQSLMKGAFRDLRNVPPDQRQTVLNSARYQNTFSPDERNILSNMLRVEPYQAPK